MQSDISTKQVHGNNLPSEEHAESDHDFAQHSNTTLRANDKIKVFVKSSRVLVSVEDTGYPSFVPAALSLLSPLAGGGRKRVLVYEKQLDAEQSNIVSEATAIARHLGAKIEVKDIGRQNILRRFVTRLRTGSVATPSVIFPGSSVVGIGQGLEWEHSMTSGVSSLQSAAEKSSTSSCSSSSLSSCACAIST
jgi:hypothetical protein